VYNYICTLRAVSGGFGMFKPVKLSFEELNKKLADYEKKIWLFDHRFL
jgi:hypothetical protein